MSKKAVERILIEYQLNGIPRLEAIQMALKDNKLKRLQDGSVAEVELGSEQKPPPTL